MTPEPLFFWESCGQKDRHMSDIVELERRLTAALDRIGLGVAQLSSAAAPIDAPVDAGDTAAKIAELEAKLAEERAVNAQLEERVKALKERQDAQVTDVAQAADATKKQLVRFDRELQKLRQVNAELREINDKLRQVAETHVSEPHLINRAMQAELEALRVTRATDAAEIEAIISELRPIVGGAN